MESQSNKFTEAAAKPAAQQNDAVVATMDAKVGKVTPLTVAQQTIRFCTRVG